MTMKHRKGLPAMPRLTRAQIDQLSRLGPWDREKDWAPTPAMMARAARNKPFWAGWESEAVQSIEELDQAFRTRCAASLAPAADPNRVSRHPGELLSERDQEAYDHFRAWLLEMHHAGLKTYIQMVQGVVVLAEDCREPGMFRRAVNLHIAVRKRS